MFSSASAFRKINMKPLKYNFYDDKEITLTFYTLTLTEDEGTTKNENK